MVSGAIMGAIAVVGAAWGGLDYLGVRPALISEVREVKTELAAVSQSVWLSRWQLLNAKRQNQGLTAEEQVEFCKISRLLGLRGAGCA